MGFLLFLFGFFQSCQTWHAGQADINIAVEFLANRLPYLALDFSLENKTTKLQADDCSSLHIDTIRCINF